MKTKYRTDLKSCFPYAGTRSLEAGKAELTRMLEINRYKFTWEGFTLFHSRELPQVSTTWLTGFMAGLLHANHDSE